MSDWQLTTPVAFFIFNRPETTSRVFDQIAKVEPSSLLLIADGPRQDYPGDRQKCTKARSIVEDNIHWECDLSRNYADDNLGLFDRFVSGLRWIFQKEEEAIILEDDCLPNEDFFRFSQTMLSIYREDERIMEISGNNHLGEWKSDRQDYHFSNYGGIWGWATWRRAWEWYDPDMELWDDPEIRARFRDVIADDAQYRYLRYIYQDAAENEGAWSYPWGFARHINNALSVVPSKNLVSNIGFGANATNTSGNSALADSSRHSLKFPIKRNPYVAVDREFDRRFHKMRPISHRYRLLRAGRRLYNHLRG